MVEQFLAARRSAERKSEMDAISLDSLGLSGFRMVEDIDETNAILARAKEHPPSRPFKIGEMFWMLKNAHGDKIALVRKGRKHGSNVIFVEVFEASLLN